MILCAECHLIGHGLVAGQYLCALIDIEKLDVFAELAGPLTKYVLDLPGCDILRYEHREVTRYRRELRKRGVLDVIIDERINLRHIQHGDISLFTDRIVLKHSRMHLAEEADGFPVIVDRRSSARMEIWNCTAFRIILEAICHAELLQDILDITLHREEIALADLTKRQRHPFIRKLCKRESLRDVDIGELIETGYLIFTVIVRRKRGKHAVHGRGPHHGEIFAERVRNLHLLPFLRILREQELVIYLRGFEAVHEGLAVTERLCIVTDTLIDREIRHEAAGNRRAVRKRHRNLRIAVEPCYLLRNIAHSMDILTEGRCSDSQFIAIDLGMKLNLLKVLLHLLRCQVDTDQMIDFRSRALHHGRLTLYRVDIDHAADHFTGVKLLDECAGTIDGCLCEVRVKPLLEVGGRIGSVADLTGAETNVRTVKGCCFEDHRLHIVCDF